MRAGKCRVWRTTRFPSSSTRASTRFQERASHLRIKTSASTANVAAVGDAFSSADLMKARTACVGFEALDAYSVGRRQVLSQGPPPSRARLLHTAQATYQLSVAWHCPCSVGTASRSATVSPTPHFEAQLTLSIRYAWEVLVGGVEGLQCAVFLSQMAAAVLLPVSAMPSVQSPVHNPALPVRRPRHRGGRGRKRAHHFVVVTPSPKAAAAALPPTLAPEDAVRRQPAREAGEAAAATAAAAAAPARAEPVQAARTQAQVARPAHEPDGPATGSVRVSVPPEASAQTPQREAAAEGGAARSPRSMRPRTRSMPEASPAGDSSAAPPSGVAVPLQASQPAPGVLRHTRSLPQDQATHTPALPRTSPRRPPPITLEEYKTQRARELAQQHQRQQQPPPAQEVPLRVSPAAAPPAPAVAVAGMPRFAAARPHTPHYRGGHSRAHPAGRGHRVGRTLLPAHGHPHSRAGQVPQAEEPPAGRSGSLCPVTQRSASHTTSRGSTARSARSAPRRPSRARVRPQMPSQRM